MYAIINVCHRFRETPFFSVHGKTKNRRFQRFSGFEDRFWKAPFSSRINDNKNNNNNSNNSTNNNNSNSNNDDNDNSNNDNDTNDNDNEKGNDNVDGRPNRRNKLNILIL